MGAVVNTELAAMVDAMDERTLADATARGLYGWTASGCEYVYSSAHNGLVFTGRRADFSRHPGSNYPPSD